jgi:hypothetical protein
VRDRDRAVEEVGDREALRGEAVVSATLSAPSSATAKRKPRPSWTWLAEPAIASPAAAAAVVGEHLGLGARHRGPRLLGPQRLAEGVGEDRERGELRRSRSWCRNGLFRSDVQVDRLVRDLGQRRAAVVGDRDRRAPAAFTRSSVSVISGVLPDWLTPTAR